MLSRMGPKRVAIVGGGLAGMMCADTLANRGFDVQVFDMGRRATGGRASVRYTQEVRLLLLINLLISLYQGGGLGN